MVNASLDDSHQGSTYRRIELITGAARRRRWTGEEKAEILAESFQPGASVSEVARRHGVNRGLLWTWRHQTRKQGAGAGPTFVRVRIIDEATALPASAEQPQSAALTTTALAEDAKGGPAVGTIDIEMGGARVRVSGSVDAAALRQVLTHLGRRA